MAGTDYNFTVMSDSLDPFGPAAKENLDYTRLVFDFSNWLESGEHISSIDFPTVQSLGYSVVTRGWQQDYPIEDTDADDDDTTTTPPPDSYPLAVLYEAVSGPATNLADITVAAGTPGYTYVVSFLVTASHTARRKQVDAIVTVQQPVNTLMAGPAPVSPDPQAPLVIGDSVALPMGFEGWVFLENSANASGIAITLPPNPAMGQFVRFIDVLGTDGTSPVTFIADAGLAVDGDASTTFISDINYDVLTFVWTGDNWHLTAERFGFLG